MRRNPFILMLLSAALLLLPSAAAAAGNGAGADLRSGDDGDIFVEIPSGVGFEVNALEGDGRGVIAMGERHPSIAAGRHRRRDAGHDLPLWGVRHIC